MSVSLREGIGPTGRQKNDSDQGSVVRSLVSANRWLRGIKTYRFPWYLTLVSANHASSNPGQGGNLFLCREIRSLTPTAYSRSGLVTKSVAPRTVVVGLNPTLAGRSFSLSSCGSISLSRANAQVG